MTGVDSSPETQHDSSYGEDLESKETGTTLVKHEEGTLPCEKDSKIQTSHLAQLDPSPTTMDPIPVTILAGFLGAGKTTMLNHILSAKHGCKIGVLVNDFGSINVDAELISDIDEGLDGTTMMTLANGCACCSIRTDLMQAVLKLATKTNPPEHIVIEASGVADPKGVYDSFLEREIRNLVLVDGVITVVDAEHALGLEDSEAKLARTQLEGCDLVVLNKVDLVDTDALSKVEGWIRSIKSAPIFHATYGSLPIEVMLGISRPHDYAAIDALSSRPALGHHHHDVSLFETWSYQSREPLSLNILQQLLSHLPTTLFRAKGFVYAADKPNTRLLLQLVGRRAVVSENRPWGKTLPQTRLVFIARSNTCDFDAIQRALQSCEVKGSTS
jgi:G3E family GTPase